MDNILNRYAAIVVLALCGYQAAHTAAVAAPVESKAPVSAESPTWALQVTPYIWATGLEGDISPFRRAPTIGVERSFSDGMDDLNFGGFVNVWGRYGRGVFSGDAMYSDTTGDHTSGPLPALPGLLPPGTVIKGNVDTKQFMSTWQAGYRVLETPDFTLDALGGLRFWHISNDVTVSALGMSRSYGEDFGWVDPVIGTRAFVRLSNDLSLQVQADIGGSGAGADLTWSTLATVNYTISDHLSVSTGYKVLHVDYDKDGHVYDARLNGPVLGMTYRF